MENAPDLNVFIVHDDKLVDRLDNAKSILRYLFEGTAMRLGVADTVGRIQSAGLMPKVLAGDEACDWRRDPDRLQRFPLTMRSVSNSLNHLDALVSIAQGESGACGVNLVVEDDCVIASWSRSVMNMLLASLPKDYDVILLGGNRKMTACNTFVQVQPHHRPDGGGPCDVVAYMVSQKAARALTAAYLPFSAGHDVHMRYLCARLGLKIYTLDTSVFFDGSKTGDYVGTIYPEDFDLSQNDSFVAVKKIVDDPRAPDCARESVRYFVQHTAHRHPHYRYLIARFYKNNREYDLALEKFQYCMDSYEKLFQNVWKLHAFVLDFIHCCKQASLRAICDCTSTHHATA